MKGRKTGGRKKGTPNKVSGELRERLSALLIANFDEFQTRMDSIVKNEEYCSTYLQMCKFVLPTLQSVDLDAQVSPDETIADRLCKLSASDK